MLNQQEIRYDIQNLKAEKAVLIGQRFLLKLEIKQMEERIQRLIAKLDESVENI